MSLLLVITFSSDVKLSLILDQLVSFQVEGPSHFLFINFSHLSTVSDILRIELRVAQMPGKLLLVDVFAGLVDGLLDDCLDA